ncbi:MAG: N-acetylmuramoyl-L-alanine amidase [Bryobacteraceae bacterium]|jgi:N-acetylmuramoyl-L-alanine amidase
MLWRFSWAAAFFSILPALAATKTGIIQVTGVRSWSHRDSTRVIVETTGPFEYKADRAHDPERLFLDISNARPWILHRRLATTEVGDNLVRRVRIAESAPNVTRIVFDLKAQADYRVTKLDAPDRLVIELRPVESKPVPDESPAAPVYPAAYTPKSFVDRPDTFIYPPAVRRPQIVWAAPPPTLPGLADFSSVNLPDAWLSPTVKPSREIHVASSTQVIPASHPVATLDATPRASENASRSLTRALGLKVNRIVIDAGHGGHDDGTMGPHGLLEKDVVLDVALRVSKLVQEKMGAEVVLTRSDDTFIPLRERTAIANEHKADLFLSIHANSSPAPEVAGTETFYLNFTNAPGSLDVAARENAGSDKTVGELRDLIQSITLNDKIEESHTFAQDIQTTLEAQAARSNAAAHNRGVKRAPFVVLIGASMPSVLAEIGFLSNSRDENNLGKPEYRQKVAEALYKGLTRYSQSLSHFDTPRQLAKNSVAP